MIDTFEGLCGQIETRMKDLAVPGVSVGVWQDGLERTAAFGVTSIANPLPVTPDTLCMHMYRAALELFLGAVELEPVTFHRQVKELAQYTGQYDAQAQVIEILPEGGGLSFQRHNKGGFPRPDSPPAPDPGPFSALFYDPDQVIVVSENEKGPRAELLRDAQGALTWLRIGGRIHHKIS